MEIKPNSIIHLEPGEAMPGYGKLRPVPDKYINELKSLINKMNMQPGSVFLKLKQLYALLNRFNKNFVSDFTNCKKGCAHCCKMDVQLTPLEAEYIVHATKIPAINSPLSTGNTSMCPFLSEKEVCSIYNFRPLLCRTYHVLSDPYLCEDPDAQVMQYGAQSANMGNFIYKTVAEWIYFQGYQSTGKIDFRDIRDYFSHERSDVLDHLKVNPPRHPC
ncbi:YkgJ family cysteine cluster protein [Serratia fonticola]|uniref:YkgJ family cysteine cluster protein n=1 Tax=Serratia fonticola TaxID=47917 RepID=A0AAJ1YE87_SERFO|nr:YkgJ family cysteine cluster protein [Serratia fonticola]MDQ9126815.1 YkgJ family cysteine cluster protein [Serratia fonticola]